MKITLYKMKHLPVRLVVVLSLCMLVTACNKLIPEPVTVIPPTREVPTQALQAYKTNLDSRFVAIGFMYGWGKADASILMHTPDSLDIIVVKDGYEKLSDAQVADLKTVQGKKATRVLMGYTLTDVNELLPSNQTLTDTVTNRAARALALFVSANPTATTARRNAFRDSAQAANRPIAGLEMRTKAYGIIVDAFAGAAEAVGLMKESGFDGISIQFPNAISASYLGDTVEAIAGRFISEAAVGRGKQHLLIVENPDTTASTALSAANWLVYNRTTPTYTLANFTRDAAFWGSGKFIPSADYSNDTDADGFVDSETFSPNGILPRTLDVINWKATNKAGAAFYHIEKNYNDIRGSFTYYSLRHAIIDLQRTQ